ncbi:MAG TPA: hypothetical protein VIG08_15045 [Gemmatimonadales bacterium]|jgi:hypothetical protein
MERTGLIVAIALLSVGCGGAGPGDASPDARMNGEWEIALTILPTAFAREGGGDTTATRGTLALLPNRAGTRVPGFAGIPQQVGTHNLRLNRLVPELGSRTNLPVVAGSSAGDSVLMVLDPGAGAPIVLRGRWEGSEVMGEWMVHRRSGLDQEGRFSLRRPPP